MLRQGAQLYLAMGDEVCRTYGSGQGCDPMGGNGRCSHRMETRGAAMQGAGTVQQKGETTCEEGGGVRTPAIMRGSYALGRCLIILVTRAH